MNQCQSCYSLTTSSLLDFTRLLSFALILIRVGMSDDLAIVKQACKKGYEYVDKTQVRENNRDREAYYRHQSKACELAVIAIVRDK